MTITAKYASECPTCGRRIAAGEQIEWSKGKPARHAACARVHSGGSFRPDRSRRTSDFADYADFHGEGAAVRRFGH